jgi:hypothetical protein
MWEFIFFLSACIAAVTVFISLIPDGIPNPKFRTFLPLICGIFLVSLVLIVNPQQNLETPRSLYELKALSPLLLSPLFILAPLPFIENKTGTVFSKWTIFFGSWITTIYYFIVSNIGTVFFIHYWQAEGLIWTIFSSVLSALVFSGIYLVQPLLSRVTKKEPTNSPSGNPPASFFVKMTGISVLIVILLSLVWAPFLIEDLFAEPCGGFEIYLVNGSDISGGSVIHLADNDFREFPKMAPIIRDTQYTKESCESPRYDHKNCVGKGSIPCNREAQFGKYSETYLEYEGRFYIMTHTYYN